MEAKYSAVNMHLPRGACECLEQRETALVLGSPARSEFLVIGWVDPGLAPGSASSGYSVR